MSEPHPSDIRIRVNSKRNVNVIHPVEVGEAPLLPSSAPNSSNQQAGNSNHNNHHGTSDYAEIKQFKKWVSWLIPLFVVANVIMFVITMYVNNCPKNSVDCVADFLGRFSFQPFKENPLLGPSSST